jgi:hypothetical protein
MIEIRGQPILGVVAAETICGDRIVIETRIFPSAGSMTIPASVGTRDPIFAGDASHPKSTNP